MDLKNFHEQIGDPNGLKVIETIFNSERSCVVSAHLENEEEVILKIRRKFVDKGKRVEDTEATKLRNEWILMKELSHPNLVKGRRWLESAEYCVIEMEKVYGEALVDTIFHKGTLNESDAKKVMKTVIEVLLYLENQGFVWTDLKPDNILYDEDKKNITLIDLESVQEKRVRRKGRSDSMIERDEKTSPTSRRRSLTVQGGKGEESGGAAVFRNVINTLTLRKKERERIEALMVTTTKEYLAPEIFLRNGKVKLKKLEMWSLGICLFVILTGEYPRFEENLENNTRTRTNSLRKSWNGWGSIISRSNDQGCTTPREPREPSPKTENNTRKPTITQPQEQVNEEWEIQFPIRLTTDCRNLLSCILQRDPKKRPSLSDLTEHSWFDGESFNAFISGTINSPKKSLFSSQKSN